MSDIKKRLPSCFAPPLTDGQLDKYKALVAAQPAGPIKAGLEYCLQAVLAWWDLPVSEEAPGPQIACMEAGSNPKSPKVWFVAETPLSESLKAQLFDHVPWDYEIEGLREMFVRIQAAEAKRNGDRIEDWRAAVRRHLQDKHFPAPGAVLKVREFLRKFAELAGELVGLLSPAGQKEVEEKKAKLRQFHVELQEAYQAKSHPAVPYPTLEDTSLRDCALHLQWYAAELERDREPMTQDVRTAG